jgi:glycosyltransferase involved in cell wall biosynthesis
MKILFFTTILLSQNRNGGEVGTQCFIDALRHNGHQVLVVGYLRKGDTVETDSQNILVVDERYTETKKAKFYSTLYWLTFSFFKGLPYSSAKYYSANYLRIAKKLLSSGDYGVVIIDHPQLSWLEHFVKAKDKLITISHNLEHELYQETSNKANSFISKFIYRREAHMIKAQEDRLATRVKQVWTVTEHDAKYFSGLEGAARAIAFTQPPASEKLLDKPLSKNFDIGLLASWTWQANQEALQWFLQAVYPQLPAHLSIHVAGKGADWLTEKYPNIQYRGLVPDAQEFMAQAKVVAIPTLSGGGIQIKTLDAIASGSAIVATPVALRGIHDPPTTVQVAQEPEEFANLLVSTIASPSGQQAFNEARRWYQARRNKFLTDVAYAINEL